MRTPTPTPITLADVDADSYDVHADRLGGGTMISLTVTWDVAAPHDLVDFLDGGIGKLTVDHAASTHGLPVVVRADGVALGPAETGPLVAGEMAHPDEWATLTSEQMALVDAARAAGYRIDVRQGRV